MATELIEITLAAAVELVLSMVFFLRVDLVFLER
jgi:hypothetical protein